MAGIERGTKDWFHEAAAGRVPGTTMVHKFGRSIVGTSYALITFGNIYQQVQVGSATALRIKAGNSNDTAAGSGAREITLEGLDETGATMNPVLATAGASASSNTSETFIRLFRYYVSKSGTYSTGVVGSHSANIVIENSAGSADWGTIDVTEIPRGQTEIACYTVPLGKTAFIDTINIFVDAAKSSSIIFMHRLNILETSAPYAALREVVSAVGISAPVILQPKTPTTQGGFPALTDLLFFGKVGASTGTIVVDFEIVLEDT